MTVIIIICYFTYIATHTKRAEKTSHNLSFSFKESLRFACLRKMFGTSFGNKKKTTKEDAARGIRELKISKLSIRKCAELALVKQIKLQISIQ